MQKIFWCSFLIITASCKNRSKDEVAETAYKNQIVSSSNEAMSYANSQIYKAFEDKISDARYKDVIAASFSKAKITRYISRNACSFIDSIGQVLKVEMHEGGGSKKTVVSRLFFSNGLSDRLYDSLKFYQEKFLTTDMAAGKTFEKMSLLPQEQDSNVSKNIFASYLFQNKPVQEVLYNLALLKNVLITFENQLISFYYARTTGLTIHHPTEASALVTQSSNIVTPGEKITISAGIGAFSLAASPKVVIGNIATDVNASGVAIKSIVASSQLGEQLIPVQIEYIQQDGSKMMRTFSLTYKVVKAVNE